jgi:hypothetical protein
MPQHLLDALSLADHGFVLVFVEQHCENPELSKRTAGHYTPD